MPSSPRTGSTQPCTTRSRTAWARRPAPAPRPRSGSRRTSPPGPWPWGLRRTTSIWLRSSRPANGAVTSPRMPTEPSLVVTVTDCAERRASSTPKRPCRSRRPPPCARRSAALSSRRGRTAGLPGLRRRPTHTRPAPRRENGRPSGPISSTGSCASSPATQARPLFAGIDHDLDGAAVHAGRPDLVDRQGPPRNDS